MKILNIQQNIIKILKIELDILILEVKDLLEYAKTINNLKSIKNISIQENNSIIAELILNILEKNKNINNSLDNLTSISEIYKICNYFLKVKENDILEYDEVKENPIILKLWKENKNRNYIADKLKSSHALFTEFIAYELEGNYFKTAFDNIFNDTMDKIFNGEIKRLIINIPMGYGKTFRATIITSLRAYAIQSASKIIHISYDNTLVQLNSQIIRQVINENFLYKRLFPNVILIDDTKAKGLWKTSNNGIFRAVSSGSGITGFRAGNLAINGFSGVMIIDDPLKPDDALSETKRTFINNRFENVFKSRLASEDIPIIVIMQRLHIEDFTNHLLEKYPNEWNLLKIPALYEGFFKDDRAINIDINKYNSFKLNKSTWEIKYPTQYLLKEKQINPNYFYTQLQQEPINLSENKILNGDWIITDSIKNYKIIKTFITADTAMKTKEYNDYSVFSLFGLTSENKLYLIDMLRAKLEFHELLNEFERFYDNYQYHIRTIYNLPYISNIYIEDKASGTPLIQVLQNKGYIVNAIPRNKDKLFRVSNIAFLLAQGYLICSPTAIFLNDVKREFNEFTPNDTHKHDDIIDTITDALTIEVIPNLNLNPNKIKNIPYF
jgi:predicted phage terminase large subunit-like protein